MPFVRLLRFVVEFVQVQVQERVAVRVRVAAQPVVDKRVVRVVDRQVAVRVLRIERALVWVVPLSSRRALR